MPRGEISTEDIVRNAFKQGKQVFVPYLYKPHSQESASTRSVMDMIALHSMSDFDSLKPDSWGIPSIPENSVKERRWVLEGNLESETIAWEKFSDNQSSCRPELTAIKALDMIVMPGVAFDESLGRLGHGKGFYDYFLSRYQGSMAGPLPFLGKSEMPFHQIPLFRFASLMPS